MLMKVEKIELEVEPIEKEPPLISGTCRKVGADIRTDELTVFVRVSVYDDIHRHALAGGQYEVGGALIGDYYKFGPMRFVEIDHACQIDGHNTSAVDITFPAQFWLKKVHPFLEELNEQPDEKYLLIGTYHTHPGHSAFLSNTDIKFVQNLFNNPWNVTMVIDHIRGDEGVFFCSKDRKISKKSGFWVNQKDVT